MSNKEADEKYTLVSVSPNNKYVMIRPSAEPEKVEVVLKSEFERKYFCLEGVEYKKIPLEWNCTPIVRHTLTVEVHFFMTKFTKDRKLAIIQEYDPGFYHRWNTQIKRALPSPNSNIG